MAVEVCNGWLGGVLFVCREVCMQAKLRVLPLYSVGVGSDWEGGLGGVKLSAKQRLELETRGNFVRSCGDGRNLGRSLDPVLAWHLGVGK